ncbi:MAG: CDP-6-deoxy-delta-3,4-glucoseen reductase [Candidatus Protistobacter heckmanni]|nr:CDP-6-deoxy-delta-3,4-glucoseen reductase [Candidatus Protistobacter heckmanni]
MSHEVTIAPSGRKFIVEDEETILGAALRAGVNLPYGCKNGACGSCKGKVAAGSVVQGKHAPSALSLQDKAAGMALFCCATLTGDVTIESSEVRASGDIDVKKLPCRINEMEHVGADVMILRLQLPANERLQFLAGQYLEFILKDGTRRSYSIATPPHGDGLLELHLRHMPGGVFTDHVFGAKADTPAMRVRDILRLEGPQGGFFLREDSAKPIVMLASGTGFAPIKAMVEHAAFKRLKRSIVLYWGGRRPQDLYMRALCEQWAADPAMPLRFVPVISDALPEDAWRGRAGLVHEAVMQDLPDLSGHQVYACGAPVMVAAAQRDFTARCDLPETEFFADSFTSARDLAQAE